MTGLRRGRSGELTAPASPAIEIEIETRRPRLELRARADRDVLPLARQALRALGQSVGIGDGALHDAELALTEACANVVKHAYRNGEGLVEVTIEARPFDLLAVVRDRGHGMRQGRRRPRRLGGGGLGLMIIDAVAGDVEVRSDRETGTEVLMALPADEHGSPIDGVDLPRSSTVERVVRRLVAMAAAQADMAPERISEALIAAEIVARHAPSRLIGDRVRLRLDRIPDGVELSIGPLEPDGTAAVLEESDMPVLGSIVERLADEVWSVPQAPGRADAGEEMALRFAA